jgi:hypothetical protein
MALLKSMSQTIPVTEPIAVSETRTSTTNGIQIAPNVKISFNTEDLGPVIFHTFFTPFDTDTCKYSHSAPLPKPIQQMTFSTMAKHYQVTYASVADPIEGMNENHLLTVDDVIGPDKITDDIYVHFKDDYDIRRSLHLDLKDKRLISYKPGLAYANSSAGLIIPYVTREKLDAWIRVFITFRTLLED